VMNVVRNVLVDLLAAVDDRLLAAGISDRVAGGVERGEVGLVLISRDVVLPDLGSRDDVLLVNLRGVLGVEDGLDVVLDVVDCEKRCGGVSVASSLCNDARGEGGVRRRGMAERRKNRKESKERKKEKRRTRRTVTVNLALALDLLNLVVVTGLVCERRNGNGGQQARREEKRREEGRKRRRRTGDGGEVLVVVGGSLGVGLGEETVLGRLVVGVVRGVSVLLEVGTVSSLVLLDLVLDGVLDLLTGGASAVRVGCTVAVSARKTGVGGDARGTDGVIAVGGRVVVGSGGSLVSDALASRLVGVRGGVGGVVGEDLSASNDEVSWKITVMGKEGEDAPP
jgi:hypothetical protein